MVKWDEGGTAAKKECRSKGKAGKKKEKCKKAKGKKASKAKKKRASPRRGRSARRPRRRRAICMCSRARRDRRYRGGSHFRAWAPPKLRSWARTAPFRSGTGHSATVSPTGTRSTSTESMRDAGPAHRTEARSPRSVCPAAGTRGHPRTRARAILAAMVIILLALLALFGITHRSGPGPRRSGKRPKGPHHLGTR